MTFKLIIITAALFSAVTSLSYLVLTSGVSRSAPAEKKSQAKPSTGLPVTLSKTLSPSSYLEFIERTVAYAGGPPRYTLNKQLQKKIYAVIAAVVVFIVLIIINPSLSKVLLAVPVVLTAFFLPDLLLYNRADKRQRRIAAQLPDVIDLLKVSVEAGLGFDAALEKVIANAKGPLVEELFRLRQEMKLGISRRRAFHNLSQRTRTAELNYFTMSVMQADTYGISIGKVLQGQSREMKLKRRQKAEEAAMKTPVKIIFPLLLCIFPALLIVILGPAGIRIAQTLSKISP